MTDGVLVFIGVYVGDGVFVGNGVFVGTGVFVAVDVLVAVKTTNPPPGGLGLPAATAILAIRKDSLVPER